jgi:hypothetical protein
MRIEELLNNPTFDSRTVIKEGIPMRTSDLDSVLDKSDMRAGFELEFIGPAKLKNVLKSFQTGGIPVDQFAHNTQTDPDNYNWILTDDGSIETNKDEMGFELISPPVSIRECLEYIDKCFNVIEDSWYRTNSSTGFHMGVSFIDKNKMKKLDKLKLITLLGEEYLLNLFKRKGIYYAATHADPLMNLIRDKSVDEVLDSKHFKKIIDELNKSVSLDKFKTINFSRLSTKNPYLEFRIAGNENYQKRFKEIKYTLLRYAYCVDIAADPEKYKKEYYSTVYRMLRRALFSKEKETETEHSEIRQVLTNPTAKKYFYGIKNDLRIGDKERSAENLSDLVSIIISNPTMFKNKKLRDFLVQEFMPALRWTFSTYPLQANLSATHGVKWSGIKKYLGV